MHMNNVEKTLEVFLLHWNIIGSVKQTFIDKWFSNGWKSNFYNYNFNFFVVNQFSESLQPFLVQC